MKPPKPLNARRAPKAGKARLDETLVARGLAESLELARALVMAGKVVVGDQRADKAGQLVALDEPVRVKGESRFVSRAGEKLDAALIDLGLGNALRGAVVLDVGASTGGFTQVCLEHGAAQVVALDVGTAQLAWELRTDPRVTSVERTDIRDFRPATAPPLDWVVADVSFNSLARLAPAIRRAAPRAGVHFLLLVKPQFELPRGDIPAGGVVDDDALRQKAVAAVIAALVAVGLTDVKTVDARLSGKSGNREVFVYGKSGGSEVS
jgi:23S rRNA (cytidine1920-2'-O)/16S rRNA (cytidine1409-2'-O)-methyltransferase